MTGTQLPIVNLRIIDTQLHTMNMPMTDTRRPIYNLPVIDTQLQLWMINTQLSTVNLPMSGTASHSQFANYRHMASHFEFACERHSFPLWICDGRQLCTSWPRKRLRSHGFPFSCKVQLTDNFEWCFQMLCSFCATRSTWARIITLINSVYYFLIFNEMTVHGSKHKKCTDNICPSTLQANEDSDTGLFLPYLSLWPCPWVLPRMGHCQCPLVPI